MSRRAQLERMIIAALVMDPAKMDSSEGLSTSAFSPGFYRHLFAELSKMREDGQEKVDIIALADRLRVSPSDIPGVSDGCYMPRPDTFAEWVAELLQRQAAERILGPLERELRDLEKTGDVDLGRFENIRVAFREFEDIVTHRKTGPRAVLKVLGEVEPQPVRWLWPNRIPCGRLSLIVGDPGLGKSFFCIDLASRLSTGSAWPDAGRSELGSTILLTAEDGLSDTVRIRADAAGADASRLIVLEAVREKGKDRMFLLGNDLPVLEQAIADTPGVRLVIIDPVSAYLGDLDSHMNSAVRGALAPLASLAEKYGIAVIAVSHLNKSDNPNAVSRVMGSLAFVAAPRACWGIAADQEDAEKERRLVLPIKTNLSVRPSSLAFRIRDGRLEYEAQEVQIDVEAAFSSRRPEEQEEQRFATGWLQDFLQAGPIDHREVIRQSKTVGISRSALYRAADRLKVIKKQSGFGTFRTSTWEIRT